MQHIDQLVIGIFAKRVEVFAQCSREEDRVLWDDGDAGSQEFQGDGSRVQGVQEDQPLHRGQAEQRRYQGRLAGPCTSYNANLQGAERDLNKINIKYLAGLLNSFTVS